MSMELFISYLKLRGQILAMEPPGREDGIIEDQQYAVYVPIE